MKRRREDETGDAAASAALAPNATAGVDADVDVDVAPRGGDESRALRAIVGGAVQEGGGAGVGEPPPRTAADFFRDVWQTRPMLFRRCCVVASSSVAAAALSGGGGATGDGDDDDDPLSAAVAMGWDGVASLLQRSRTRFPPPPPPDGDGDGETTNDGDDRDNSSGGPSPPSQSEHPPPLLFKDQTPLQPPLISTLYADNPLAAYLDGCSVVINHADAHLCGPLASLCLDMQRSLPHVYVNVYVTPPNSSAVAAHADDRDVFVVQITGRKRWRVYGTVPVPYPYEEEQVGKGRLSVPEEVLEGPLAFENGKGEGGEVTLEAGDVLYMPRGYVHEARCADDGDGDCDGDDSGSDGTGDAEASCHATVAVATNDWTLAGVLPLMVKDELSRIVDYRRAVDLPAGRRAQGGKEDAEATLQAKIDAAFEVARTKVTSRAVTERLEATVRAHNDRARGPRERAISLDEKERKAVIASNSALREEVVGPTAATQVFLSTRIRAATAEERASVLIPDGQRRGLTVRDDGPACDSLMAALGRLRVEPGTTIPVGELRSLMGGDDGDGNGEGAPDETMVEGGRRRTGCDDLTLLAFARCCVEMGAVALVGPAAEGGARTGS